MTLLRRLTSLTGESGDAVGDQGSGFGPGGVGSSQRSATLGGYQEASGPRSGTGGGLRPIGASPYADPATASAYAEDASAGLMAVNLIRAHRDELMQASSGKLDHMVIDVVGSLFDQILSDSKVPPQFVRQIARLQLPVLRAALGDSSFFSSRKHPVRRFVNRIASLGAAFEDFDDASAHDFLAKVKALVSEVVDGDFDQLEVYEQKLKALEAYVAEQAQRGLQGDAARLLAEKEDQLRLRALYAERLSSDLRSLSGPAFVRDFIAGTWSQVLLRAADAPAPEGGEGGRLVRKFRSTARELAMSVQPKTTPAHRKAFLAELPKLMQELSEGMDLIAWPEAERRAFFGQLMPAHAEALKAPLVRQGV